MVKYLSINQFPITLGLSLHTPLVDESDFFIAAGFGGNFRLLPSFSYQTYDNRTVTTKNGVDATMCFKIKAGVQFDDTYFLSINYFSFFGGPITDIDQLIKINKSNVSITLGYGF